MADLLRPETFEFFARFLLAGFIIISVRSRLTAARSPKPGEILLDAVVLSLINQAVFLGISALVGSIPAVAVSNRVFDTGINSLAFYAEILVCPVVLGILFGRFAGSGTVGFVLRRLSMPGTHPIAEAYDFAFAGGKSKGFVILTYSDDTVIFGYFGDQSLAASDDKRSDIFLEALYVVEDGQWRMASPPRAAWISLAGIRSIEFLKSEENTNGA
ncbi:DUF6338 family protein [Natronohydrobacter thiooxidans]|uniref:DUF6338 family protein n=1 Tax=Natronohydrobacter thiooxidans TaxID=87172 RepID=UPI0008FF6380|nr:DUF6338 family protein [Natronohydrobacter thiooxidans]